MSSRLAPTILAALSMAPAWLPAHATTYRIDPRYTTAGYEVRYLGLFTSRGEFRRTTGTLVYDIANKLGSIDVSIDASTLEAGTAGAQASARGPDFFDVDKHPSIDFKSRRFVFDESTLRSIEGSLTLIGKTQPVVLTVSEAKCITDVEQEPSRCRAAGELRVKRSAFGMKAWSHLVSEEVTIRIAITALRVADMEPSRETSKEAPKETLPAKETPKSEPAAEAPPAARAGASGSEPRLR